MDEIIRCITSDGAVMVSAIDSTDIVYKASVVHHTSPVASAALGRLLSAASMMGAQLKSSKSMLNIRFEGDGDLGAFMAVADSSGNVKGFVTNPDCPTTHYENGKLNVAAAVGAGVFDAGTAVDGAGTVECLTPVYAGVPPMEPMYDGNYAVVPYVVPGTYVTYAFSYTGGALIQWFTETLAGREKSLAEAEGISVNEYLERQYAESRGQDTPSGLLVLPHFAGAATPYMDTGSRGVIAGLTAASTAADIYRGCLEGVVYEMCLNVEHLEKSGLQYHRIRATGGGAKSALWMQMKADMLNVPVEALRTPDAGTVGSAMLTGAALGYFGNLQEAAEQMVEVRRTFEPRLEMHEKYRKIYERYRELYEAVRPLM